MTSPLRLNQIVRNMGILARVIGFHEVTGDPILRPLWNDGACWLAAAAQCEPLERAGSACLRHKDGLAIFG
jgi:hypothetical protein